MPLAETASTFCELLVNSAAMKEADTDTRAAILENSIAGVTQTCIDIRSRFLFEDTVFAKRKKGSLSVDELKECMQDAQRSLRRRTRSLKSCIRICGSTSRIISCRGWTTTTSRMRSEICLPLAWAGCTGKTRLPEKYDAMLALTGKANVADVAQSMGIDLTKPDFFRASSNRWKKRSTSGSG